MIHVDRIIKPNILVQHEAAWLIDYHDKLLAHNNNPTVLTRNQKDAAENKYKHTQVKTALETMFSGKCAYCESHITHVDYGDIEHFRPKSKFPNHCFDWNNLLLACGICNGPEFKGTKFPGANEGGPFVNPVDENPNTFFNFEYDPDTGTANVIRKHVRGDITERELGLNRTDLVRHRSSVVRKMVLVTIKASQGDNDCKQEILHCCRSDEEYAAFAQALVERYQLA